MEVSLGDISARNGRHGSAHVRSLLASIVADSNDAIWAKDRQGRIILWNPAAADMLGYAPEEIIDQSVYRMVPPDLREQERVLLQRVLSGERVSRYETERMCRDGRRITLELTLSPVRDDANEIVGASVIARDVSKQKETEAKLRHYAELKNHFVAMASHELRTPLTSITGFSSTMLRMWDEMSDADKRQLVGIIDEQGTRLTRLVNDLLMVSRIESGRLEVHPERRNLCELIRKTVKELGVRDVQVACDLDLEIVADPDQVQQMLVNFIGNAMKYGRPPILVDVSERGGEVEICVCDHGAGVPEEFVPRLFEKFSQPKGRRTQVEMGTGLGLSIVRGLADAHGGEAFYRPNAPGGACFGVRLPKVVDGCS